MTKLQAKPSPPKHLQPNTKAWFKNVIADYDLEEHHVRLLTLACESWDRCVQAREAIAEHGLTITDRFGFPRARPEVAIERDAKISFARLCRELDLDTEATPENPRPPALRSNRVN